MIDIKELKTRYDEIKKNITDRYMNVDLDAIIAIQDERYTILQEVEVLRAKRNENAQKMKGKLGGQHKVPRLSNTRNYIDEIISMNQE